LTKKIKGLIYLSGSIYGTKSIGFYLLSKIEKILKTARGNPQNLRFDDLCYLCEFFGGKLRKNSGSHRVYKRSDNPTFMQSVQNLNGKAKPYQVQQLLNKLEEIGLI
jgi:hypothetical protein